MRLIRFMRATMRAKLSRRVRRRAQMLLSESGLVGLASRPIAPASMIRAQWEGQASHTRKLCLFSSFDSQGIVDPYVFTYLEALAAHGWSIVFVTSAPAVDAGDLARLQALTIAIVQRKNCGRDFAAWRLGVGQVVLDQYDQLLLANDSVYGPLLPLEKAFDPMEKTQADLWGISDSFEGGYHVQSYFLMLRRRLFADPAFANLLCAQPFSGNKYHAVKYGEMAITDFARMQHAKVRVLCPYDKVSQTLLKNTEHKLDQLPAEGPESMYHKDVLKRLRRGVAMNPTHYGWRELCEHGSPFIKVDLLRDNPQDVPDVEAWREVVDRTEYDVSLIANHLARVTSAALAA